MQIIHPTGRVGRISSPFGKRVIGGVEQFHPGTDFAVPVGTPILAPLPGQVIYQGNRDPNGYGLQVILRHGENLFTQYGHLSKVLVAEGDRVDRGQVFANSGNTGRSSGPHLHFEVRVNAANWKDRVNPEDFLAGRLDIKKLLGNRFSLTSLLPTLLLTGGLFALSELI